MSPSLHGLRTVIYPAPDLDAAKAWWTAFLGADPYFDQPFYVGYDVAGYELGLLPDGALKGQPLRRSVFNKSVKWHELVAEIGVPNLHLHDLRHTGNTLATASGASLKDLMTRMGHDSPAAALIYQHATREADAAIAIAMNDRLSVYLKPESPS